MPISFCWYKLGRHFDSGRFVVAWRPPRRAVFLRVAETLPFVLFLCIPLCSVEFSMPRLIINADDLGAGELRDRGIFESFTCGIVTSASLLANGPSFASAVATARQIGLPLGVHLNLADGDPLCGPIPGLTLADGGFPGKTGLRRLLSAAALDPAPLARELAEQIERLLAAGITPDHLDTHQHIFLYPQLTAIVLDLAAKYAIPALRLPVPGESPAADAAADDPLCGALALYRQLAPACVERVRAARIATPDGLFGMPLLNRLDKPALLATLAQIPAGNWELMVHPGYADDHSSFGGVERQTELLALTSPQVAAALREAGITPITFRELTCAS